MTTLIRFSTFLCSCVICFLLLTQPLSAQNTTPQTLPELGNEFCSIMMNNPGDLLDIVPVYYISEIALISELGGQSGMNDFLQQIGMSRDKVAPAPAWN